MIRRAKNVFLLVLMVLEYLPTSTDGHCIVCTITRIITYLDKLFPSRCAHILQLGHQQLLSCQPHLDNMPGKEVRKKIKRICSTSQTETELPPDTCPATSLRGSRPGSACAFQTLDWRAPQLFSAHIQWKDKHCLLWSVLCGTLADLDGIWMTKKLETVKLKGPIFFFKITLHFFLVLRERLPRFMRSLQTSFIASLVVEERGPCFFSFELIQRSEK